MTICPNCGSDRLRLQMALEFDEADAVLVCGKCGFAMPKEVPPAIEMIVRAARRFPNRKLRRKAMRPAKYRGIVRVLLRSRQMSFALGASL